jgi:ubiquinone/menaquinone biosynthesis C-methylase UbiE
LDAGAGERPYKERCSHLRYFSQDFAQYNGEGDGKGIQTGNWDNRGHDFVCDITSIPVADSYFDNVLCTEVLEHVPDPVQAFKELHRVVKPGGRIVITVPFNSITHFAPYHFCTEFSVYFFTYWSEQMNIAVRSLIANGNYFEYLAQEIRYMSDVSKKYSNVRLRLRENVAQRLILSFLQRNSTLSSKTSELQCFGYFYVGIKK